MMLNMMLNMMMMMLMQVGPGDGYVLAIGGFDDALSTLGEAIYSKSQPQ